MKNSPSKSNKTTAIVLLSGGLDSAVCLWWAKQQDYSKIVAFTFQYGSKEENVLLPVTKKIVELVNIPDHKVVSLDFLAEFSKQFNSALIEGSTKNLPKLSNKDLDDLEKSTSSAKSVWIPARNLVFLSIVSSYADVLGGKVEIIAGFNLEEGTTFPDNTKEFIDDFTRTASRGVLNAEVFVTCPLVGMTKAEIVQLGAQLHLPFEFSSSCYNPLGLDDKKRPIHCGVCESCLRRQRGFREGGVQDPTMYGRKSL